MHTQKEIADICAALTERKGINGMTYLELIFYVAFDAEMCNNVVNALDNDAMKEIHSLLH